MRKNAEKFAKNEATTGCLPKRFLGEVTPRRRPWGSHTPPPAAFVRQGQSPRGRRDARQRRETERGVFAQARLATNCRARFPAVGGRLASLVDSAPAGQMRRAAGCDFHKDGGEV